MLALPKLEPGDKVAIVSPSFAAPAVWPHVYRLGIERLQQDFGLEAISYPGTAKPDATNEEKAADLVAAFDDPDIKAVISSTGGDNQVTYIKHLPVAPFVNNPKPFFGYSDNSHLANFLFLNGVPSFYGGSLFSQFAMQGQMDAYTAGYLRQALFTGGEIELRPSDVYNDVELPWNNEDNLSLRRLYEPNSGWLWDGTLEGEGLLWGGCLESVDEMLRHRVVIPALEQFEDIVLMLETSEELPSPDYVFRVVRALGELGVLARVKGVLVGRAKAWNFEQDYNAEQKQTYRDKQGETVLRAVRSYNPAVPVIQNMDFGHTDPQIPMPYGGRVQIQSASRRILAQF